MQLLIRYYQLNYHKEKIKGNVGLHLELGNLYRYTTLALPSGPPEDACGHYNWTAVLRIFQLLCDVHCRSELSQCGAAWCNAALAHFTFATHANKLSMLTSGKLDMPKVVTLAGEVVRGWGAR